ncbi:hypothetical protein MIR68_011791 [Amoeboaphelidium protococcarum]|nr:hypothetical protein MIR68_011791 [Amoeboaphelidium protococcarum]
MVDSTAANTSAPPLPVQDYQDSGTYGTQSSFYNNNNNNNNLMSRYGGNNYRYGLNGGFNSNISSFGAAAYSPYSSPYNSSYSTSYGLNSSPYGSYGYGNRYGGGYPYGMGGYNQQQNMLQSQQGGPSNPLMVLEHAVQILSSVTHLLDSTIMATHSSFMGVIGLIEQVGVLKSIVGGVVGLKWLSTFMGLSSRDYQSHGQSTMRSALSVDEFNNSNNNSAGGLNSSQQMQQRNSARRSRFFRSKSFMIMVALAVIFVIPWLMKKVQRRRQLQQTQQQEQCSLDKSQTTESSNKVNNTLDITFPDGVSTDGQQIEFARSLYDFTARNQNEISFKKGDLIAVTFKGGDNSQGSITSSLQQNTDSTWWRGKKRQGHIGYFPSNYVSLIGKQVDISADQFITQSKGQQVQ